MTNPQKTDFIAAKALIFHERRFLAVRHTYAQKDFFDLPGGRIEPGETLEQTVVREGNEEVSLELIPVVRVGKYHVTRHDGRTVDVTVIVCESTHLDVDVTRNPADTENITGYAWLDPYDITTLSIGNGLKGFLTAAPWDELLAKYGGSR